MPHFQHTQIVWGFHISTISPVYPTISAVYPHYTTLASMIFFRLFLSWAFVIVLPDDMAFCGHLGSKLRTSHVLHIFGSRWNAHLICIYICLLYIPIASLLYMDVSLKWGHPQIIHFRLGLSIINHPAIGYPHWWKPPRISSTSPVKKKHIIFGLYMFLPPLLLKSSPHVPGQGVTSFTLDDSQSFVGDLYWAKLPAHVVGLPASGDRSSPSV